jgi:hypothetical protein
MKSMIEGIRAALPEIGTEFRIDGMTYIVTYTDKRRFLAKQKSASEHDSEEDRRRRGDLRPASIFDPEDWVDEYHDGRQLLDPEPEDWGWRNV